jgi:hypothetical protein
MKRFGRMAAATLAVVLVGCDTRDQEIKAHAEEDYERFHQQLEQERAMDAYRRSPEHRAKVLRDLRHGIFGSSNNKGKVIP